MPNSGQNFTLCDALIATARHWSGADHVQNAGGIVKGHQTNFGFSAQRTTRSTTGRIHNALRLKLHGAPAALKDRADCFYKARLFLSSRLVILACVTAPKGSSGPCRNRGDCTKRRHGQLLDAGNRKGWSTGYDCTYNPPRQISTLPDVQSHVGRQPVSLSFGVPS
jgi:hypothetical protein